jgi:hypothetical protein
VNNDSTGTSLYLGLADMAFYRTNQIRAMWFTNYDYNYVTPCYIAARERS